MTDYQLQRLNMVESQVRPSDVTDRRIIKAMLEVPREKFVASALASMAHIDEPLPVGPANGGGARVLLAPRTFAKLVQLAKIEPDSVVLDIGCATGYSTAVLAKIATRVMAVESDRGMAAAARDMLVTLGAGNATVIDGPLAGGAPAEAPFDAIVVNGGIQVLPPALLEQLRDGGRLVGVLAEGVLCRAQVWHRTGQTYDARPAFEAAAPLLPGFERPPSFVF